LKQQLAQQLGQQRFAQLDSTCVGVAWPAAAAGLNISQKKPDLNLVCVFATILSR
jgi:hypothetical protein